MPVQRVAAATLALLLAAGSSAAHAQSGDLVTLPGSPDVYVVQPGDTLWDISSTFLGNPYYWPKLWSINEYITNPHWIYPGNQIVFQMGTEVEPPQIDLQQPQSRDGYSVRALDFDESEVECGPDVRFETLKAGQKYTVPGFLAHKDDVEVVGTVDKAHMLGSMLSERDTLYLKVDDPDSFDCGDIVSIFRRTAKNVHHPNSRRTNFGDLYEVVADARVIHKNDDYVVATIRDSYSEVYRGDLVGPPTPVQVVVDVAPPDGDMEAWVVARLAQNQYLSGDRETVFVDRGRGDGVRAGDAFYIVEQRDEFLSDKEDLDLPMAVIGRVVIVRVDEDYSTGVVVDASRRVRDGAHLVQAVE